MQLYVLLSLRIGAMHNQICREGILEDRLSVMPSDFLYPMDHTLSLDDPIGLTESNAYMAEG